MFWKKCEAYSQECTAVHERRHDNATYLARAISVRDLVRYVLRARQSLQSSGYDGNFIQETHVRRRLNSIASAYLWRWWWWSKRDSFGSCTLTSIVLQYSVTFENMHYSLSAKVLICADDKHRLKVGEPDFPVAAAERGQRVIVSLKEEFQVGDHDFTCFSIIPSVIFCVDIQESIKGSWYGQVWRKRFSTLVTHETWYWTQLMANYGNITNPSCFCTLMVAQITVSCTSQHSYLW